MKNQNKQNGQSLFKTVKIEIKNFWFVEKNYVSVIPCFVKQIMDKSVDLIKKLSAER